MRRVPERRALESLCQAFHRERRGGADTGPRWGDRSDIASLVPKDVDVWFEARRGAVVEIQLRQRVGRWILCEILGRRVGTG